MSREDVLADLGRLKPMLAQRGVTRLRLFGSFARDEAGSGSDVDLVADFDRPISLIEMLRLERAIGDVLGRKVDLATTKGLKARVRARIDAEAIDA
jgi:predicted nucleotidyltransferase